ncbi:hypothetical protein FHS38_005739 [Streptomyces netropsis]|uniref:Uncharacterized protein n=1 Tax=Streptomyces netropsis TaxID=55404 RepID=A0A7W7LHA0_STRNE|nr:hypothetical protein [Streptomyces netropsis]
MTGDTSLIQGLVDAARRNSDAAAGGTSSLRVPGAHSHEPPAPSPGT